MFKVSVAGSDTFSIVPECTKEVRFSTDIPLDSNARTKDVGTSMIIRGKILTAVDGDPFDSTRQLALWSAVPAEQAIAYRNVTVENIRGGIVERKYNFPNAFVVDYKENYGDTEGVGEFVLTLKQKKDKIENVTIVGGFAGEE
jgi:hypothetical protein